MYLLSSQTSFLQISLFQVPSYVSSLPQKMQYTTTKKQNKYEVFFKTSYMNRWKDTMYWEKVYLDFDYNNRFVLLWSD